MKTFQKKNCKSDKYLNEQISKMIMAKEKQDVPTVIEGQECPICKKKTLKLMEADRDVPHFGKAHLFSMNCSNCKYHKADVEFEEKKEPCKCQVEIESEKDLNIRLIKSSQATIKLGRVVTIESDEASNGYISNVEGLLKRVQKILELARDSTDDKKERKKAKNHLKKVRNVLWGEDKIKLTIEDKTGNSAIISDKATRSKLN